MMNAQWARLETTENRRLRRGAWYRVAQLTAADALLAVNRQSVAVPRTSLKIVGGPPRTWTVVPRPNDAKSLPVRWGDRYAVCPGCRNRARLNGIPDRLQCPRCHRTYRVGWDEWFTAPPGVVGRIGGTGAPDQGALRGSLTFRSREAAMSATLPPDSLRRAALLVGVAGGYFLAGQLGLRLAALNPSATAVSPAAGIALAALLIWGRSLWPAILVGGFLVHWATTRSVASALAIGAGDTVEALLGAYLVQRFARGRRAIERPRDIFTLAVLAGAVSTVVSASASALVTALEGLAPWSAVGSIWMTRWLGDAVGDVVVAPALLLWARRPRVRWRLAEALEVAALLASTILVGVAVFAGASPWGEGHYPLEFLCLPPLLWAAFRFTPREAATIVVVLSAVAIAGTLAGFGPFARPAYGESLLLLQAFTGVTAVMTLVLATAVASHKEAEDRLRHLAVSDPLTGLANYRELTEALETEIRRSSRTDRPFALMLADLDGLKTINDRFGHLVGSLAVRRVAETLLASCRGIDTAARFGGDEFALVLPETGDAAAWRVARRVAERVARDGEEPRISVSIGVAVHPRDGASLDDLLNAADRSLYAAKAQRRQATRKPAARPRP